MSYLILGPKSRHLTPDGWLGLVKPFTSSRMELTEARLEEMRDVAFRSRLIADRTDQELHGKSDHWSLPVWTRKILSSGIILAGDCEDIALWIRRQLVKRGWPRGSLRLCYCRQPDAHIVLIAQTSEGDYILSKGSAVPLSKERRFLLLSAEAWPSWQMILSRSNAEVPR